MHIKKRIWHKVFSFRVTSFQKGGKTVLTELPPLKMYQFTFSTLYAWHRYVMSEKFCMFSATPSKKYNSRTNKGEVMVNFGSTQNMKWEGSGQDLRIEHYSPEHAMTKSFKYMFQKLSEKFRGMTSTRIIPSGREKAIFTDF